VSEALEIIELLAALKKSKQRIEQLAAMVNVYQPRKVRSKDFTDVADAAIAEIERRRGGHDALTGGHQRRKSGPAWCLPVNASTERCRTMKLEDVKFWRTEGGAFTFEPKPTGDLGDCGRRGRPYTERMAKRDSERLYLVGFSTEAEADAYTLGISHADAEEQWFLARRVAPDLVCVIVQWNDDCGDIGIIYHDERRRPAA
jgi:hypothetical protein